MPASQVKNRVIAILLCVCVFLLSLVIPLRMEEKNGKNAMNEKMETLFASYGLTLDAESIPVSQSLFLLELNLDQASDLTPVTALLGQEVLAQDDSTRYLSSYRSELGQCQISRDGSFQAQLTQGAAGNDLKEVTREVLEQMGVGAAYVSEPVRLSAGIYQMQVIQSLLGVPNFSTRLSFRYENNVLTEISGTVFWGTAGVKRVGDEPSISAEDALVRLLSSRNQLGWVGKSVYTIRQGYIRTETASTSIVRFTPVWLVETDTGYFQINGITGEVTSTKSPSMG